MTIADSLRHLGLSAPDPGSDGELVERFVRTRDEPAFAELLRRHGPTVYGVCRRVLGNGPDADDAFQAVFLVMARKAGTIRPPGKVGNWLYGVAVRTANKARVMNARKANRERELANRQRESPGEPDRDTRAVIDTELAALPDQYRAAFVACDLNGRSRSEAARDLGWPEGTVAARLAKARELLAARLTKRGVTLGVGLFAAVTVPTATATEAMSAVRELLAVGTASAVAPAAQSLSDEVVKSMTLTHTKWLLLGGLVLMLATGGAVLLAGPGDKPIREHIKAPVPKEQPMEWNEGKPIELEDAARITGTAVSADGKFIAITQDGKLTVLAADTRKKQYEVKNQEPGTITAVAFNPKGDKLAVTRKDAVDICDAATGRGIETWEVKGFDPHQVILFTGKDGREHLVATNGEVTNRPDSNKAENGFKGWAENRHKPCVLAPVPGKEAWLMAFDNSGKDADKADIFVWTPADIEKCARLIGHKARPVAAAVSADGKRIVSADEGGTLIVWEGEKTEFKEKRRVELGDGVAQVALAPDGQTVTVVRAFVDTRLFGTSGRTLFNLELFVFDVTAPPKEPKPLWETRGLLSDAKRFTGPVSLAFSPDGTTLLAAFADPYTADNPKERGAVSKSMGVKVWELVPKK